MRSAVLVFTIMISGVAHAAAPTYSYVPSAEERNKPDSGFVAFPNFPRMELVKEGDGTPNPDYVSKITDSNLKKLIESRHFFSLQVRDLAIVDKSGQMGDGPQQVNNVFYVPFAVSVKHTQENADKYNPRQGTIEVAGVMLIFEDGQGAHVMVSHFYDSQLAERWGRSFGYNSEINLDFARGTVKPMLESFFNDPTQQKALFDLIRPQLTRP